MGYTTTPITVDQGRELVNCNISEGEVVSASQEKYFDSFGWMQEIAKAELKDDSITIFFTLHNEDFVEYCCVNSEDMTTKEGS